MHDGAGCFQRLSNKETEKIKESGIYAGFLNNKKERETGLEPAASTLARSRSTN